MEIKLKISPTMDSNPNVFVETRSIRMPRIYREFFGYNIGEFIALRTKDGSTIGLQVHSAYTSDVLADSTKAYVCSSILELLSSNVQQEVEVVDDITLGADPEFFLLDPSSGCLMHAGKYFEKLGELGHDGVLAEIRPMPSTDANVVINNIRGLLNRARTKIDSVGDNRVSMIGSSTFRGLTAGFHLHYGLPKTLLSGLPNSQMLIQHIVRVMDYFVGVPSVIPEGHEDSARRCVAFLPYGKAGDYRMDTRTLEYRVPGGSLLRHPTLSIGLMSLGAMVIEDVVSRIKAETNSFTVVKHLSAPDAMKKFYPSLPDAFELVQLINVPDTTAAQARMDDIRASVTNMVGYHKRAVVINTFFDSLYKNYTKNIDANWETRKYLVNNA